MIDLFSLALGLAIGCFVSLALSKPSKGSGYRPVARGDGPLAPPPFSEKK